MKDDAVLVLVINQASASRLIQAGRELADRQDRELRVLSIQPRSAQNEDCAQTLEHLFQIANQMQADLTVYYNDDAAATVIEYIRRQRIGCAVVGQPPTHGESLFLQRVRKGCKGLAMYMIEDETEPGTNAIRMPVEEHMRVVGHPALALS